MSVSELLEYGRKSFPDENVEENEPDCNKRFRHVALRLIHFWNMWRKEYFTNLIELDKAKVSENSKPIEVGDIIVVYAENKKRALENSSW
jgi:hypothetical protein